MDLVGAFLPLTFFPIVFFGELFLEEDLAGDFLVALELLAVFLLDTFFEDPLEADFLGADFFVPAFFLPNAREARLLIATPRPDLLLDLVFLVFVFRSGVCAMADLTFAVAFLTDFVTALAAELVLVAGI